MGFGPDAVHLWYEVNISNKEAGKAADLPKIEDIVKEVEGILDDPKLHITIINLVNKLQVNMDSYKVLDKNNMKLNLKVSIDPQKPYEISNVGIKTKGDTSVITHLVCFNLQLRGKKDQLGKSLIDQIASAITKR